MVLSMLSTIQAVKLQNGSGSGNGGSSNTNPTRSTASTPPAHSQSPSRSPPPRSPPSGGSGSGVASDMSRRKQRNPKPLFPTNGEEEGEEGGGGSNNGNMEEEIEIGVEVKMESEGEGEAESKRTKEEKGEDEENIDVDRSPEPLSACSPQPRRRSTSSPPEDLTDMVKVEVREGDHALPQYSPGRPILPTLTPRPDPPSGAQSVPDIPPAVEEMMVKNGMFHFGDVTVATDNGQQPETPPPVPMVIPMTYLLPIVANEGGKPQLKYRMFVPLNGHEAPQMTMPPMPPIGFPHPPHMQQQPFPTGSALKVANPRKRKAPAVAASETEDDESEAPLKKETQHPLDLSKSGEEDEDEDEEVQDENRKPKTATLQQQQQLELEAHLNFLKVKQLELLKSQQHQQAQVQAQAHAQAQAQKEKEKEESRCEECNINFSKHQNYIAHKKYYCSGGATAKAKSSPQASVSSTKGDSSNEAEVMLRRAVKSGSAKSPPHNGATTVKGIISQKQHRSSVGPPPPSSPRLPALPSLPASAAAAAAALGLLGMTASSSSTSSPSPSPDAAQLSLLKQQQEFLLKNDAALKALVAGSQLPQLPPPPPTAQSPLGSPPPPPAAASSPPTPTASVSPAGSAGGSMGPGPHFVCEGCGIKFKSVTNLQAHQARYCAGLRSKQQQEELGAFEAMLKRSQNQQQQQQQFPLPLSAAEMMSFLNAKSLEQQAKAMASAAAAAALAAKSPPPPPTGPSAVPSSPSGDDFCCILCGYKEQSVERLKDHINMHFIGQIKKEQQGSRKSSVSSLGEVSPRSKESQASPPPTKKIKSEDVVAAPPRRSPSAVSPGSAPKDAIRCESCDIGFAHLSNFLAHKKYYCRGQAAGVSNGSPPPPPEAKSNATEKV